MEKLEFDVALKTIGSIKKVGILRKGGMSQDFFAFHDIGIYLSKDGYAAIVGHFPLALSMKISMNYRTTHEFVVSGNNLDVFTEDDLHVIDGSFDKEEYLSTDSGRYMRYFYVKTPETLLGVLHAFESHFGHNDRALDEVLSTYNANFEEENKKRLHVVDSVTVHEVVPTLHIDKGFIVPNPRDVIIRDTIADFKDCINPFQMEGISLKSFDEYKKDLQVTVNSIVPDEAGEIKNLDLSIVDRKTKTACRTKIWDRGFSYEVSSKLAEDNYFRFKAFYSPYKKSNSLSGFVILVDRALNEWSLHSLHRRSTIYNLSTGLKFSLDNWSKITDEDRETIEEELRLGIECALSHVFDNIREEKRQSFKPKAN